MRIDEIELSWFRGAAQSAKLKTHGRSCGVYGTNGSGKSSFVDAIEYILADGKIVHLANEYSGKRQENAIINTHAPAGASSFVELKFDGATVRADIDAKGYTSFAGVLALAGWDMKRLVLRQNEVSNFVHASKGNKYSTLLPLIGLDPLERAAVNLRGLARKVREVAGLDGFKARRQQLIAERKAVFGDKDNAAIGGLLKDTHRKYLPKEPDPASLKECVQRVRPVIETRIASLDEEKGRHVLIVAAYEAGLAERMRAVKDASAKAAGKAEPLLYERLEILKSAQGFAAKLDDGAMVVCPACGREIEAGDFKQHVAGESKRLKETLTLFEERRLALGALASAVKTVKEALSKPTLAAWRAAREQIALKEHLAKLQAFDQERLRTAPEQGDLDLLEAAIPPISVQLAASIAQVPPAITDIVLDKTVIDTAAKHNEIGDIKRRVDRVEALAAFLDRIEGQVRDEIKKRSDTVIREISGHMQRMWAILHPDEPIENIHLYMHEDVDKAIDIALKFFGKEQPSPLLTLSEGHRNSLGLCVFLALAKSDPVQTRPLVLDDVVTSFDREHRGMVADLLMTEFPQRQILLFTHDRDWYIELKIRLRRADWNFRPLKPWESPNVGIQWAASSLGFDDARAYLPQNPSSAGNTARGIMDTHLAVVAERINLLLPYRRGDRNDQRGAVEFLQRIRSEAGKALKRQLGDGDEPWTDALAALEDAEQRLLAWGNPASHGREISKTEAQSLIGSCETALNGLYCTGCKEPFWALVAASGKYLQCGCGAITWRL